MNIEVIWRLFEKKKKIEFYFEDDFFPFNSIIKYNFSTFITLWPKLKCFIYLRKSVTATKLFFYFFNKIIKEKE